MAALAMLSMDDDNPSLRVPGDSMNTSEINSHTRWGEETKVEESETVDPHFNATFVDDRPTAGHNLLPVPGALAIFTSNFIPRGPSLVEEESTLRGQIGATQTGHEDPLVAHLVEEPSPLPTTRGIVIDTKQRRLMNALWASTLATVVATITSIAVVYTRPNGTSVTGTQSPTSSLEPSASPSLFPSASPSTSLFGFLAERGSYDNGAALSIHGSPQQQAMNWLNTSALLDYQLLQTYVLATLYYATLGDQWTSSGDHSTFLSTDWNCCDWKGVRCNSNGDVYSLNLSSNRLIGSIPAELAVLDKSLSKVPDFMLCHSTINQITNLSSLA